MTSGNDYVLQVKGNQPKRRAAIAAVHAADPTPAGATHCHDERRDGRQVRGQTSVYAADPRWQAQWAGVAGCVMVVKTVGGRTPPRSRRATTSPACAPTGQLNIFFFRFLTHVPLWEYCP